LVDNNEQLNNNYMYQYQQRVRARRKANIIKVVKLTGVHLLEVLTVISIFAFGILLTSLTK